MSELTFEEYHFYSPYYVDMESMVNKPFVYEQFLKRIYGLPKINTFFLENFKTAEFVKKVIEANGLNKGQGKEIARVIRDLLLTDAYLGNVVNLIQEKLNVNEMKAKTIAGLIVSELFAPILDDLKKMHIEKFAKNLPRPQLQNNLPLGEDDRIVDLKNNL